MKKTKTQYLVKFSLALLLILYTGCSVTSSVTKNYEVECVASGNDGTQLLKVWTYVKNENDASKQAKINGIHAVIFKGVNDGAYGCMQNGLVSKHDAENKHEKYFNTFFKENGKYLSFVSLSGVANPDDRIKIGRQYKIGIVVSVRHSALRKQLEADGVIDKLWMED